MRVKGLYAFLLVIPFLPFLNAQYLLRDQLSLLTAAPLFIRQNSSMCPPDQTPAPTTAVMAVAGLPRSPACLGAWFSR